MNEAVLACSDGRDDERVHWLDGRQWHAGSWSALAQALAGRTWVLLVDGSQTTLLEASLPVRDLATARRAAPFAIEEQLAAPLDTLRVAVAPRGEGTWSVAACAAATLETLSARLAEHHLRPELVTAEPLAVPLTEQGWTILVRADAAIIRTGPGGGVKFPLTALETIVPQLRAQLPDTARVTLLGDAAAVPLAVFEGLEVVTAGAPDAAALIAGLRQQAPPALLEASASAALRRRARQLWLAAAAATVVAMLAYPALLALGNAREADRARALATANEATLRAAFPEISRVVNPRVQATQALADLRGRALTVTPFLAQLAAFERAFATGLAGHGRVRSIAYTNGVLEISIATPDMAGLERVRTVLGDAGLGAEMLSAESTDDGVIARLRLQEPG